MVAAISPAYGRPTRPAAQIITSGMWQDWTDMQQLARAAIDKAILIERAEAPEREAAAKKSQEVVEAATHAKARLANKAAFTF
jgi:hypothetical protein